MSSSDRALAARFRAGEEAAVREVYQRYGGAVTTVARSMLSDPEQVADVVQQTFVKAWRGASSFEADRDLAPWLYSIARRTAIDALRQQKRRGGPSVELSDETEAPTALSFERTWETWEIRRAIDDLPEPERQVIALSHLHGMTHTETADRLNIAVGTVKSRSARAHKRLAAALRHLQIEAPANREDGSFVEGGTHQ